MTQEEQLKALEHIAKVSSERVKDLEVLKQNQAFKKILETIDDELEKMKFPYYLDKENVDFYKGKYYGLLLLTQAMGNITTDATLAIKNLRIAQAKDAPLRDPKKSPFE